RTFLFFQHSAPTYTYTLSLHDALPIFSVGYVGSEGHHLLATHDLNFGNAQTCLDLNNLFNSGNPAYANEDCGAFFADVPYGFTRSEEHTSELQSLAYLVCRLLLEKKKI